MYPYLLDLLMPFYKIAAFCEFKYCKYGMSYFSWCSLELKRTALSILHTFHNFKIKDYKYHLHSHIIHRILRWVSGVHKQEDSHHFSKFQATRLFFRNGSWSTQCVQLIFVSFLYITPPHTHTSLPKFTVNYSPESSMCRWESSYKISCENARILSTVQYTTQYPCCFQNSECFY